MNQEYWDESFKQDPTSVHVDDHILKSEIKNLQPGTALDLGCGAGYNGLMLAEAGWSVVGVDWSEHAVKLANESAEKRGLLAQFIVGDITSWQPADKFDLVISTYALPGGQDSLKALDTALSALKTGATLIVAEWDVSMAQVWDFEESDLTSLNQIVHHLTEVEIEAAEVRQLDGIFDEDDPRAFAGTTARIVFVRARKV